MNFHAAIFLVKSHESAESIATCWVWVPIESENNLCPFSTDSVLVKTRKMELSYIGTASEELDMIGAYLVCSEIVSIGLLVASSN